MATKTSGKDRKDARQLIARRATHGEPRGSTPYGVSSLGSERAYASAVAQFFHWCHTKNIAKDQRASLHHQVAFLNEMSEFRKEKTIAQYRHALQIAYCHTLPVVHSKVETEEKTRSINEEELLLVCQHLPDEMVLPTLLAYYCGFRAHEIGAVLRYFESGPSPGRPWLDSRFAALENFQRYLATGKGGLRYEKAIPNLLAAMLEEVRLAAPRLVKDRGIFYSTLYDVAFGQRLSQAFTTASRAALGFSTGFHGLRHSYAKRRVNQLLKSGMDREEVLKIVSQEMGHFRENITLAYLR